MPKKQIKKSSQVMKQKKAKQQQQQQTNIKINIGQQKSRRQPRRQPKKKVVEEPTRQAYPVPQYIPMYLANQPYQPQPLTTLQSSREQVQTALSRPVLRRQTNAVETQTEMPIMTEMETQTEMSERDRLKRELEDFFEEQLREDELQPQFRYMQDIKDNATQFIDPKDLVDPINLPDVNKPYDDDDLDSYQELANQQVTKQPRKKIPEEDQSMPSVEPVREELTPEQQQQLNRLYTELNKNITASRTMASKYKNPSKYFSGKTPDELLSLLDKNIKSYDRFIKEAEDELFYAEPYLEKYYNDVIRFRKEKMNELKNIRKEIAENMKEAG